MGAQGAVKLPRKSVSARTHSNTPQSNGEGNEGHEGSSGTQGDEEEGSHEGHEGDEEEGGHEGHEGDEEEGSHEGHEGDEEEGSHEGYEGDEEEVPMDSGCHAGTQGSEDHWLRCYQEGHTSVCKGKGDLQPVSAALSHVRIGTSSRCGDFHSCGAPHP